MSDKLESRADVPVHKAHPKKANEVTYNYSGTSHSSNIVGAYATITIGIQHSDTRITLEARNKIEAMILELNDGFASGDAKLIEGAE